MRVQLTRKLADRLDGIDVKDCKVGDVLDLAPNDAAVLVAEGWATLEDTGADRRTGVTREEEELIGTS